jgi:hypothetical protein
MRMDVDELEQRFRDAPAPPRDGGVVALIVVRRSAGLHDTPARAMLDPEHGVIGDRWSAGDQPKLDAQVTIMERRVAEVVSPGAWQVPGDNLVVDFELSDDALPPGTRLRIGAAELEVTALPHTGCAKFRARVGDDAIRWVNAREHRPRRMRGIHARIVRGGEVAVGDRIERVAPPT